MRGKKRPMDGAGKVNVRHESERHWDRRVHTGGGGQRRDGGQRIVQPQFSYYLLFNCKTQLTSALCPQASLLSQFFTFVFKR